jgi:hypothetical protein
MGENGDLDYNGMMKQLIPNAGSSWLPYGMGWLSIIVDPTGAMLGLWQTKS